MDNLNFGSGSQLLAGGNEALKSAIAARQTGQGGQMNAVSPASQAFDPNMVTPEMPNPQSSPASTVPQGGSMASSIGQSLGMPQGATSMENELILKALSQKLKDNASIEKIQGGVA